MFTGIIEAVGEIAGTDGLITCGNKCCGLSTKNNASNTIVQRVGRAARGHYYTNDALFRHYRFCLVMENTVKPGYITEKIINAFMGGCIP